MTTKRHRQNGLAVAFVDQHGVRRNARPPPFAPLAKRDHRRQQIEAFFGEPVFNLAPVIGARRSVQDAAFGQPRQPVRQYITRDTDLGEELLEMADAVERAAQDHERPAFTHCFQCVGQSTFDDVVQRLS